jgi:hypothetical protein
VIGQQLSTTIQCPYCWQSIDILVDGSIPEQEYTEDCQVCCRPIIVQARIEQDEWGDEQPQVAVRTEDE